MSAVSQWAEQYQAPERPHVAAGIPWLDAARGRALERFTTLGWPTTRQQAWRHTSLGLLEQQDFSALGSQADTAAVKRCLAQIRQDEPGHWLVFVDGQFIEGLAHVGALPAGAKIQPLSEALRDTPDLVEPYLADETQGDSPAALNLAMGGDGAVITLATGVVVDEPIHLVFISATPGGASFPRNLITAEAGAQATVVEHYASAFADAETSAAISLSNAVTQVDIASDAKLTHMKLQLESPQAFHLALLDAKQAQGSEFNSHSVSFGARLARHDIATRFDGTHCKALLNGLYHANARRHVDHNTLIDHAQPYGESREHYRGVLADTSRGVFTGRILVGRGADGTDAVQRSDSLLLSRLARADARPELEIYADDVKCAHGATVGQLDDNAMFYLRTRGMDEAFARNLLTYAFAAEAIARIEVPGLRRRVGGLMRDRLPGGEGLGELQ